MVAEAQPRVNMGSPYKLPQTNPAGVGHTGAKTLNQCKVPGSIPPASSVPASPGAGAYKLASGASEPSSPGGYRMPGAISQPSSPGGYKMSCGIKGHTQSSPDNRSGESSPTTTAPSTVASSQGSSVDEVSQNWFAENPVLERREASFPSSSSVAAGGLVTAKSGDEAVQKRHKVVVTDTYTARVPFTDRSLSEDGCGVIVKIYSMGAPGHICDVIWDNGKFYQGYCIGYNGMHDLAFAAPGSTKRARTSTSAKQDAMQAKQESNASRMRIGSSSKSSSLEFSEHAASSKPGADESKLPRIDCMVAYVGSAPKIDHTHKTSLWDDNAEPLFKR